MSALGTYSEYPTFHQPLDRRPSTRSAHLQQVNSIQTFSVGTIISMISLAFAIYLQKDISKCQAGDRRWILPIARCSKRILFIRIMKGYATAFLLCVPGERYERCWTGLLYIVDAYSSVDKYYSCYDQESAIVFSLE